MGAVNFLSWIIAGAIIGFIARFLMPGRDPIGCLGTILLGIVGALIGGEIWEAVFDRRDGIAWIGSIIVAMVLLGIFRNMTYRRSIRYYR